MNNRNLDPKKHVIYRVMDGERIAILLRGEWVNGSFKYPDGELGDLGNLAYWPFYPERGALRGPIWMHWCALLPFRFPEAGE